MNKYNKGNIVGIVLLVLAFIALLWFFNAGKAIVLSRPNPNTITASAVNYDYTNMQGMAYRPTNAYVTIPIASSSSASNYSTYYPSNNYPRNTYTQPVYYPPSQPSYPQQGGCYVGGCSNQICSDQPSAISTCEYRPEYSCYSQAGVCERQASGQCGWSLTPQFYSCTQNAR
ncbi:MAG: hypothetical protein WC646_03635 [Candidatus Paceibacterota bacterium]